MATKKGPQRPTTPTSIAAWRRARRAAHVSKSLKHDPPVVLVIEDDPWLRQIEVELLAGEGYATSESGDGASGLRLAQTELPDLIVLDLALPSKNGLDVLTELRSEAVTANVPVMIVSAYAISMKESDKELAQCIIQKPFDLGDFLRAADQLIGRPANAPRTR